LSGTEKIGNKNSQGISKMGSVLFTVTEVSFILLLSKWSLTTVQVHSVGQGTNCAGSDLVYLTAVGITVQV